MRVLRSLVCTVRSAPGLAAGPRAWSICCCATPGPGGHCTSTRKETAAIRYMYVKDLPGLRRPQLFVITIRQTGYSTWDPVRSPRFIDCRMMKEVVPTAKFTVTCTGEPHAPSGPLDVARMRATFGFEPAYSLREGLADYVRCESLVH